MCTVKKDQNGLICYYFADFNLSELVLIDRTTDKSLTLDKKDFQNFTQLSEKKISIMFWRGYVKFEQSGNYKLFLCNHENHIANGVTINIDDQICENNSYYFEKNTNYKIEIEKVFIDKIQLKDIATFQLKYSCDSNCNIESFKVVEHRNMSILGLIDNTTDSLMPNQRLSDITSNNSLNNNSAGNNPIDTDKKRMPILSSSGDPSDSGNLSDPDDMSDILDTDGDGIPDNWEINGYTIINKKVVKWEDEYEKKGLKKYISNPFNSHTANDPYTDYEKAAGEIDKGILEVAHDPMVVAYPVINVNMEMLVVSVNQTISQQEGTSASKSVSQSISESTTNSLGIQTTAGYSNGSFSVSATFTASTSTTNAISNSTSTTSSDSFINTLGIDTGHSAYLNPNVRYHNIGTCPIYHLQPTTSVVINNQTVATIKVQENQIGNFLSPNQTYPKKGFNPLALNTIDQFSSQLISINYEQLQAIDRGVPIVLETDQFSGSYLTFDTSGNAIIENHDWNDWLNQIESTSIKILFEDVLSESFFERRVVAKNPNNPNDGTPEITLREACEKALNLTKNGEKLYFQDLEFNEDTILIVIDKATEKEVTSQLAQQDDKGILDVKIRNFMQFLMKTPVKIVDFSKPAIFTGGNVSNDGNSIFINTKNTYIYNYSFENINIYGSYIFISAQDIGKKYMLTLNVRTESGTGIMDIFLNQQYAVKNINVTANTMKIKVPFVATGNTAAVKINIDKELSDITYIIENIHLYLLESNILESDLNDSSYDNKFSFEATNEKDTKFIGFHFVVSGGYGRTYLENLNQADFTGYKWEDDFSFVISAPISTLDFLQPNKFEKLEFTFKKNDDVLTSLNTFIHNINKSLEKQMLYEKCIKIDPMGTNFMLNDDVMYDHLITDTKEFVMFTIEKENLKKQPYSLI